MITKKFSKTYDEVLIQSYLFQSELVADQVEYSALSPLFDSPFAGDFLVDIEAAGSIPTNEDDLNFQTLYTQEVEDKMVPARAHYQKLLYYVGLAFPGSETILKLFGNNQYLRARHTPLKMVNLLENSFDMADSVTYKATLIATGFIQTDITLLDTIATDLIAKIKVQQDFIKHSVKRSEERVIAFNKVWDSMVLISNASKQIFKNSPAKIVIYQLYPEGAGPGLLTAPENLTYDQVSGLISWSAVDNSTSYRIEVKFGEDFEEIYADTATETYYTPPSSPSSFVIHAMARNAGGLGPVSPLTVEYDPPLQAPSYISLSVVNATTGAVALNWESIENADFYRLFHSQVALGTPIAGEYMLVGEYPTASYDDAFPTNYRHWFQVSAGNSEKLSLPSDSVYVDLYLVP